MEHYKVAIIGAGPGGYETAIRLNQLNISVVCFEKERIGGVCLNKGCIPTKTLVKSADLYHEMKNAAEFGLENCDFPIYYQKILNRKRLVVEKLVTGIEYLFKKRQISIYKKTITKIKKEKDGYSIWGINSDGIASSLAMTKGDEDGIASSLAMTEREEYQLCTCEYVILATGSKPKSLPFLPFDGAKILSSDNILEIDKLPKSLTIIGGGVIGCEFASIYRQLGVEVTIIEFLPELVATEDEEISKRLNLVMKKSGIKIMTKYSVESGRINENHVELTVRSLMNDSISTINSEQVLISVGRKPIFDIEVIDFELKMTKGFFDINEQCQTNEKNIFAIGDVTGKLMLAHTASKQGLMVADYINNGKRNNLNYQNIPSCIFTNPEIASCGLTESQAKEKFDDIKIGRFPFAANGKALASNASFGFVKTIIDSKTDLIIGIHIIGYLATELIAQASILINSSATVNDVEKIIFAHPTISECIMESIEDTHKRGIHLI